MAQAESFDVAVVGAGIAGSALATALARDGYQVLLLERQTQYRDKVRGEVINCWGVVELMRLGLEPTLLAAGGSYADKFVGFDETVEPEYALSVALSLDRMLPGIPGVLDVGHPDACEAMNRAASTAGATVVRGTGEITVTGADHPTVRYDLDDLEHEVSCRIVVGADGRLSTVRRQLDIPLTQTPPRSLGGGLLVENLYDWPADTTAIGTEGDLLYFVFPRVGGKARLYLLHDVSQKGRFAGPRRNAEFLSAFQFRCIPNSDMFADARPASSAAFYPMNDSWTAEPFAPGGVLIGDAAGWTDPIIGQGLCVALRDARSVWEALTTNSEWSPKAFESYGIERAERMRRLRLAGKVRSEMAMTFTPAGAARRRAYSRAWPQDPVLAGTRLSIYQGPEKCPAESFEHRTFQRILALT